MLVFCGVFSTVLYAFSWKGVCMMFVNRGQACTPFLGSTGSCVTVTSQNNNMLN